MSHKVYLIAQAGRESPRRRVYVGYTSIGPPRRLDEYHNRGREPATADGRPWELGAVVSGFETTNQAEAYEIQLQAQEARGLRQKVTQAAALAAGPRWRQLTLTVETMSSDDRPPPPLFARVRSRLDQLFLRRLSKLCVSAAGHEPRHDLQL